MASTTYLAPGVYVEEVPSAQQAIAGVGTNTVGFIGVVEDVIEYPVPNEDYDPVKARAATAGPAEKQRESGDIREEVRKLEAERTEAQAALDTANRELGTPELPDQQKRTLGREKERRERRLAQLTPIIQARNQRLQDLQAPVNEAISRPYKLEKFDVKVDPFVTVLCTNFTEYTSRFGFFSADDPEAQGRKAKYPGHRALTHAVAGFFKNGGTRCFVARIPSANQGDIERALTAMESIDAVAIVAAPGLDGAGPWGALMNHCDACGDRFAILDCPPEVVDATGNVDTQALNFGTPNSVLPPQRNKNAAFYFPYIEVIDPAVQLQDEDPARERPLKYRGRVYVAPSGHVAGIYARTDELRGVHKAPANAAVVGAVNVKYYVSRAMQGLLNPQGVNCIRNMNGDITVWGARGLGGDSLGEWKYISVRRFFLFLRESIDEGTQWVVFEPNDPVLWGKIRRNVSAFLTNVWRTGALFGLSPEEAFYVKCDAETNPPEVRDLGMVVTEIGVAIARPAEFVIFRITQSTGLRAS
jgi:Bacteriophage tail sheath protein